MADEPSKTELFAWRNKGYDDAMAGRPISEASKRASVTARRSYHEGRRAARNAKSKGEP